MESVMTPRYAAGGITSMIQIGKNLGSNGFKDDRRNIIESLGKNRRRSGGCFVNSFL